MQEIGLKPLFSRIIVKRMRIKKVGSIVISETSQEIKVGIGEVIAVGPDCEVIKAGVIVLFGRYAPYNLIQQELLWAGIAFKEDQDVEYLLMNEEDVLAVKSDARKENCNA